jgi:hypothetical protein
MPKHHPTVRHVDTRFEEISRQILARRELFGRCGTVTASWRRYDGHRLGPYYRLDYRDGARHRSIYLGKCPEVAEKVRELLAELQEPMRRQRRSRRRRRQLVAEIRAQKARWGQALRARGLYIRGYSVYGWHRLKLARRAAELASRLGIPCTVRLCDPNAAGSPGSKSQFARFAQSGHQE